MLERELQITDPLGLHAQASAKVVQTLSLSAARPSCWPRAARSTPSRIMGVMLLAAGPGTTVRARIDGDDEAEAMTALVALFEGGF